ncbi:leukocyte elastase inhibitor-like [Amphibalanus amphitrite]|uniref:leukocyte elastase inhibitor-like n=1 Tax=Amphibalanus amphitrite TaxID=1232801 RepID=UPI001C8FB920|nr:leukocyte elastase inhibitor-like [Amphibalanus amphitrite]
MVRRVVTMVRRVVPVVVLVAALLCGESGADEPSLRPREVVALQQTQFGLQMYSVLAKDDQSSNIFFSPLSIGTALAMVYAGSRGDTSQQMEEVLGFQGRRKTVLRGHRGLVRWIRRRHNSSDVTVKVTNRVYASPTLRLRARFAARMRRLFYAKLKQLDFSRSEEAAAVVNANVNEDTAGRITELVDPGTLDSDTALLLVNAVYFKGAWLMEFDTSLTAEADFHALSGTRTVQMMKAKKYFPVGYSGSVDARVLKLPYKGEAISMLIVLPNEMDGIHLLDAEIHKANMEDLIWSLDSSEEVEVQLPRFKMEEKIDLKETLKKMGLTDLFDLNEANLSGISRQRICVSDVVHKAAIEVTEEGTTATAATAVGFSFRMLRPKPEPFIVDRPFFFVLRDEKTGASLFIGRVMEP